MGNRIIKFIDSILKRFGYRHLNREKMITVEGMPSGSLFFCFHGANKKNMDWLIKKLDIKGGKTNDKVLSNRKRVSRKKVSK